MGAALLLVDSGLARLPVSHLTVILVLMVTTMCIGPASADASAFAGACLVTLDVDYSATVTAVPASSTKVTLRDAGGNFCFVEPGGVVDLTISSSGSLTLADPPGLWGCVAGIATGTVTFDLDLAGFPDPTVDVVAVNAGGVIAMALLSEDIVTFTGAATLAQAPLDTVGCVAGSGHTSTQWTGVLVFQDPTLAA